jgi:hypothetical protein
LRHFGTGSYRFDTKNLIPVDIHAGLPQARSENKALREKLGLRAAAFPWLRVNAVMTLKTEERWRSSDWRLRLQEFAHPWMECFFLRFLLTSSIFVLTSDIVLPTA